MAPAAVFPVTGIAYAQTANRNYSISAQDLGDALRQFGAQSGRDVVFDPVMTFGKTTKGIHGSYSAEDALQAILAGSGLRYTTTSVGFAIRGNAAAGVAETAPAGEKIAEILVTGRRNSTLNADIRRTENDPQPYVVFDGRVIEKSGAPNLEDFFRQHLPMSFDFSTAFSLGGSSSVTLRGLAGQTLVLINGRRASGVSIGGSARQPNLNGIPVSAIERIEVLPATASGIYGGGATGGVINVILKRNYRGVDLGLSYGNGFSGGIGRYRVEASGGLSLEGGRTTVMAAGSYEHVNPLLFGERPFLSDYLADFYAATPAGLATNAPRGATPNIRSTTGANLVLDNGTPLNASFTSVPLGYAGISSDAGAALVSRAGRYNLDVAPGGLGTGADIIPGRTILSLTGNIQRDFGSGIKIFFDSSYSRTRTTVPLATGNTFNLAANAAGNPFQQAIQVTVPTTSTDFETKSLLSELRLTGGVSFKLPYKWAGEFDYAWSRSRLSAKNGTQLATAASAAVSAGTINVFRDTIAFPIDLSPYAGISLLEGPYRATLGDASLRLGGPVFRLPGGETALTLLIESRDEHRGESYEVFPVSNGTFFFPRRSQSVESAYAELRLPIFSSANNIPLLETLEVQLSARHDRYTSHGVTGSISWLGTPQTPPSPFPTIVRATNKVHSTDYTAAVKWNPIRDLALRGSYGTGFLPPSVDQLASSTSLNGLAPLRLLDPLRGNELVTGVLIQGGNPNLKPERSRSWSVGMILTPRILTGFRASLDYTNIRKTDNITSYPGGVAALYAAILAGQFTDRLTRGPNLSGDQPGWPGPITKLDSSLLNLARTKLEAVDAQLDYEFQTHIGNFHAYAIGTYQPHFQTQVRVTDPQIENVGFSGGALKWKGNVGLNWSNGPWEIGWVANYFHSYLVYPPGSNATQINQFITLSHGPNLLVPSQIYHDLNLSYRFGEQLRGALSGMELQLVIRNILNQKPPRDRATYSPVGDPRLANYWLTIKKHF
jgi:outer membrane receptor protein involved in Fe transport